MSDLTIYKALRAGGLSPAGACGVMGNMDAESAMIPSNVQDNCTMNDHDYTYAVDNNIMSKEQFIRDSYGYGLCQWTSWDRKEGLYNFARQKGVSIADESMQCEFCLYELKGYKNLYKFLCTTDDIAKAAERVCAEFERPKYNNFAVRINSAQRFYNLLSSDDSHTSCGEDSCQIEYPKSEETCNVNVRVLHKGCLGRDVFLLQAGLFDSGYDCGIPDGDYGVNTESAVKQLQKANSVDQTGIADWFVWQTVLQPR